MLHRNWLCPLRQEHFKTPGYSTDNIKLESHAKPFARKSYIFLKTKAELGLNYSESTYIERCILEIDHWMLVNRLKLNKDKTELLVISAKHLSMPVVQEISVVSETIRPSQKARNMVSLQRSCCKYLQIIFLSSS